MEDKKTRTSEEWWKIESSESIPKVNDTTDDVQDKANPEARTMEDIPLPSEPWLRNVNFGKGYGMAPETQTGNRVEMIGTNDPKGSYTRTPDLEKTFMTPVKQYEKCELCNSEITTDFGIMKCLECNVYIDSNGIIRSLGKDSQ